MQIIPSEFHSFKVLQELNCSHNKIWEVEMLELNSLGKLILSNNKISKIQFINKLPSLTYLDLSSNHISILPNFSQNLNILKLSFRYLNIMYYSYLNSHNKLVELSNISQLDRLQILDLSYNQIELNSNNEKNLNLLILESLEELDIIANPIHFTCANSSHQFPFASKFRDSAFNHNVRAKRKIRHFNAYRKFHKRINSHGGELNEEQTNSENQSSVEMERIYFGTGEKNNNKESSNGMRSPSFKTTQTRNYSLNQQEGEISLNGKSADMFCLNNEEKHHNLSRQVEARSSDVFEIKLNKDSICNPETQSFSTHTNSFQKAETSSNSFDHQIDSNIMYEQMRKSINTSKGNVFQDDLESVEEKQVSLAVPDSVKFSIATTKATTSRNEIKNSQLSFSNKAQMDVKEEDIEKPKEQVDNGNSRGNTYTERMYPKSFNPTPQQSSCSSPRLFQTQREINLPVQRKLLFNQTPHPQNNQIIESFSLDHSPTLEQKNINSKTLTDDEILKLLYSQKIEQSKKLTFKDLAIFLRNYGSKVQSKMQVYGLHDVLLQFSYLNNKEITIDDLKEIINSPVFQAKFTKYKQIAQLSKNIPTISPIHNQISKIHTQISQETPRMREHPLLQLFNKKLKETETPKNENCPSLAFNQRSKSEFRSTISKTEASTPIGKRKLNQKKRNSGPKKEECLSLNSTARCSLNFGKGLRNIEGRNCGVAKLCLNKRKEKVITTLESIDLISTEHSKRSSDLKNEFSLTNTQRSHSTLPFKCPDLYSNQSKNQYSCTPSPLHTRNANTHSNDTGNGFDNETCNVNRANGENSKDDRSDIKYKNCKRFSNSKEIIGTEKEKQRKLDTCINKDLISLSCVPPQQYTSNLYDTTILQELQNASIENSLILNQIKSVLAFHSFRSQYTTFYSNLYCFFLIIGLGIRIRQGIKIFNKALQEKFYSENKEAKLEIMFYANTYNTLDKLAKHPWEFRKIKIDKPHNMVFSKDLTLSLKYYKKFAIFSVQ